MNRKILSDYVRVHRGWLSVTVISWVLFSCIMALDHVPPEEIAYGAGLCFFAAVVFFFTDLLRFRRRYEEEEQHMQILFMEAREQERSRMEQKSRELQEYYTMWVHQIKTPISAMRLLLRELSGETDVAEEMDALFDIERYVDMALQYTRLESESTDFLLQKTRLDKVIKDAVHKYARLFVRNKIKLVYSGVEAWVYTDEKWLGFVIGQILSNAVKYTPAGSVRIYMQEENVLVVEDTGIGIRAEDLPRVFEKGYTGYNGHVDQCATGIGLYLCNKILNKLSHRIQITSQEGKGTKVSICFPVPHEKTIGRLR